MKLLKNKRPIAQRAAFVIVAVMTAPVLVWAATTVVTVDSTGVVGVYTSLVIPSDGLPVISYYDQGNSDLKVAKCSNSGCTASTITTVDSTGVVGLYTSITVSGSSLMPVISYYDAANSNLKLAKCSNSGCTASTNTTVDSTGVVGPYTSIAIGNDGLPIISYMDSANFDLKVAKCSNSGCTASTITTVDSAGTVGMYTDIAVDANGIPVVSYYDQGNSNLKVAKCSNSGCTASTTTTVDSAGVVGQYTSIAIGGDGLPVISYYDQGNFDLKVAKCSNSGCTASTITTVESTGAVGQYTSIAIGNDDLPVISYYDSGNLDLKVAKCSNSACTASKTRTLDASNSTGQHTAIAIASDGYPSISYFYSNSSDLKFAHCDRVACIQISPPSSVTGLAANVNAGDVSLSWTNPTSSLFDSVIIRRSSTVHPVNSTGGTAVTTTSGTSYTDSGLSDGTYFYSVFTVDEDGNISTAAQITAIVGTWEASTMKAYWEMNDSVLAPPDATGNGYTGTTSGALALSTDVPSVGFNNPYSYSFNGNSYFNVSRPISDDFTMCAWIKTSSNGAGTDTEHYLSMAIAHAETAFGANDFGYGLDADGNLVFGNGNGSSEFAVRTAQAVNTGNWVHTCVTRVKNSGSIYLYVNGTVDGSGSGSVNSLTSNSTMTIGWGTDGAAFWNGNMDDFRVYEYVLTPNQIASLADGTFDGVVTASSSSSQAITIQSTGGGRRGGPGRGGVAEKLSGPRRVSTPHSAAPMSSTTSVKETLSESVRLRICARVMKWFRTNEKMLGRINTRLEKRFGFTCEG